MTLVHNCFMRAINSIYYHGPYVAQARDITDLLRRNEAFVSELNVHRNLEENTIFPMWIETTGNPHIMDASTAEHAAFHDGLDQLKQYASATSPAGHNPRTWSRS